MIYRRKRRVCREGVLYGRWRVVCVTADTDSLTVGQENCGLVLLTGHRKLSRAARL